MEVKQTDQLSGIGLEIDADAGRSIGDAGKWAKFIAIVVLSCCGIALIALLFGGRDLGRVLRVSPIFAFISEMGATFFIVGMVITIAILTYLYYLLYNFAQKTPAAIALEDTSQLNEGLKSLKLHFIISTVIAIVSLLFTLYSFTDLF